MGTGHRLRTDLRHANAQIDEEVRARDLQHGPVPNDAPLVQRHGPDVGCWRADLPAERRIVLRRSQHLLMLPQRGHHNLHADAHIRLLIEYRVEGAQFFLRSKASHCSKARTCSCCPAGHP